MDKEKILEKSRKENQGQDEMERQIRIEGESFSVVLTLCLGLFLLTWKMLHGEEYHDILAMFWCTTTGCALYRAQAEDTGQDFCACTCLTALQFGKISYGSVREWTIS